VYRPHTGEELKLRMPPGFGNVCVATKTLPKFNGIPARIISANTGK
jgi:hypothetical protein